MGILIVAKEGSGIDYTNYTANTTFGLGDDIWVNEFVVYDGTGTSVTVSGLDPNKQYYFTAYEYGYDFTDI